MKEIRCVKCNRRLFDMEVVHGRITIKCPKCGTNNTLSTDDAGVLWINSKILGVYKEQGTGYVFKTA